jgi:hypothetical protein
MSDPNLVIIDYDHDQVLIDFPDTTITMDDFVLIPTGPKGRDGDIGPPGSSNADDPGDLRLIFENQLI